MSRVYQEKVCVICGKLFTPRSGAQKCCSDECKEQNKREYMKDYMRGKHKKKPESPFTNVMKYAKENDISYGEAVARMDKERGIAHVVDNTAPHGNLDNPHRNHEGYSDPTAFEAMKHLETAEDEKFNRLIKTIFSVCTLAGFEIRGRVTFVNKETGKVYN